MLSRKGLNVLTNTAYPVCRRGRHFYFRLFLLSRKVISKAKIPRKTIIISYAVIYATSLPMYSLAREATTLSWVLSSLKFYHNFCAVSSISTIFPYSIKCDAFTRIWSPSCKSFGSSAIRLSRSAKWRTSSFESASFAAFARCSQSGPAQ